MIRKVLLLFILLLLVSCSTDDDATVIGADFILDREWANPVDATFFPVTSDTWFEAIARGGYQEEILIGGNRKFTFSAAVRWDDFPAVPESIVSASLLIEPTALVGMSDLQIERIAEDWREGVSVDSFALLEGGMTIPSPIDSIVPIDVEWVQSWADPEGTSRGLLFTMVDAEGSFMRIPAREEPDSNGKAVQLRVVYRDSSGLDSLDLDPVADRFDGLKGEGLDYSLENEPSDTILIGMRESLTNQSMFQLSIPEPMRRATINRAQLQLSLVGVRLEDDETLNLEAHVIIDNSSDTTDCPGTILCDKVYFEGLVSGSGSISGDHSDDSYLLDLTSLIRRWVAEEEWTPRFLLRASENSVSRRYLSIHSAEAGSESLKPRLKVLYTPSRPGLDG